MYGFPQFRMNIDPDLEAINDTLRSERLYALSDCGGQIAGQPTFMDVVSVNSGATKTVTFTVRFPMHPSSVAWINGQKAEITLRFQKDGSLYDGSVVKVHVQGVLWEGTVRTDPDKREWSMDWQIG